jgi:hypothetical protein
MSSAEQKSGAEAGLGPHSAFVVQFRRGTELNTGAISGRVEHVVSGRVAHFQSLDELMAFVRRVLSAGGDSHADGI